MKKMFARPTSFLFILFILGIGVLLTLPSVRTVFAEQSGSSPNTATTSRIKTVSDALVVLNYGSTSAGGWGDWGTMWNRIYSAAINPSNDPTTQRITNTVNGTGGVIGANNCTTTFGLDCYTSAKGGVDDYNNNGTIPSDTYKRTWTTCVGPGWCGTSRAVAEKQDPNTNLVWSPKLAGDVNWFVANNCKYPNGLPGDDGVCGTNGEVACYCVKHTGVGADTKTGCEAYDDGNWRLPHQKELMQSYIDGSWGALTNALSTYWSSTTNSTYTNYAWNVTQSNGGTNYITKVTAYSVRCVR